MILVGERVVDDALAAGYPGFVASDDGEGHVQLIVDWVVERSCGKQGLRH
jgi:hypothetical protein